MSDSEKRARVLRVLTARARHGRGRPWWAERAACLICSVEARMWEAGVVPSPRPM